MVDWPGLNNIEMVVGLQMQPISYCRHICRHIYLICRHIYLPGCCIVPNGTNQISQHCFAGIALRSLPEVCPGWLGGLG